MPQIRFSISGRVAGRAHIGKNLIEFNPKLIRLNPAEFLERTPGHEVAHLVSYAKAGDKRIDPHGKEWAHVMWAFSLPAIRCHSYVMEDNQPRKKPVAEIKRDGMKIKPNKIGNLVEFD